MATTPAAAPHPVVEAVRDASAALAKAVDLPVWSLDDAAVVGALDEAYASDRVAVKAVMRAGFGFVHAASVVKITTA